MGVIALRGRGWGIEGQGVGVIALRGRGWGIEGQGVGSWD